MVRAVFHFNNFETKRELKVYNSNKLLQFCRLVRTYFEIKLGRSLTFRHYFVALHKKLSSLITMVRRVADVICWAKILCTVAYSTIEYRAPVWCRPEDESWLEHRVL